MTVEITQIDFAYSGTGSQVDFPTPYFLVNADIVAFLRPQNADPIQLVYGLQYTLSGAGNKLGGTLTIIDPSVVPGSTDITLVITTDFPEDQKRNFPRVGSIDNREYERGLDKLTMICQQLNRGLYHSLHAPDIDLAGSMALPLEYLRANRVLAFDGNGLPDLLTYGQLYDKLVPFLGGLATRSTILTIEDLGMVGDGGTDETAAFNTASQLWSDRGGATFYLRAKPGGGFLFNGPGNVRSGISVIFAGGPVKLGAAGLLRIGGDVVKEATVFSVAAAASFGDSQLYINPSAGGSGDVSVFFPPGKRIALQTAAGGYAELQVIGSDQFRVTLAPNLPFAVAVGDLVQIITQSQLTVQANAGDAVVTVASTAGFTPLCWVMIEDDKTSADAAAGGDPSFRLHCEIAQVLEIGASTLTLHRRLEHNIELAFHGRVVRLDPVQRASVSGASFQYAAAPTQQKPTLDIYRAVNCETADCEVTNEDPYGSVGDAFRFYQSCDSRHVRATARNPKSTGPSTHGCSAQMSTGCTFVEPDMSGYRHNIVFRDGSTQCHATDAMLDDDRAASILFAGADEVGCTVSLRTLGGSTEFADDITAKQAVKFGLDTGLVGPRRCVVEDGKLARYDGIGTAAVRFVPGAVDCSFRNVAVANIGTLLWHEDSPFNGAIVARGCAIDCVVDKWSGRLIDVQGALHGAAVATMADLSVHVRAAGGSKYVRLANFDGIDLHIEVSKGTVDVTEPFAVDAYDGTRLSIKRCDIADVRSGIQLTRCPGAALIYNIFERFSGGTLWFSDGGGNAGVVLNGNVCVGFAGTPSTGLDGIPILIT